MREYTWYIKKKLYSIALVLIAIILVLVSTQGAAPFAYITNLGSNNVSVINTTTNNVTATEPVGIDPNGVAITPDGSKVYVAKNGHEYVPGKTVSEIDTITNNVTATVNLGIAP